MFRRILPMISATAAPLLLSQCALIFEGTKDPVTFTSRQSGGSVQVDGASHSLPATVQVSKKTDLATFSHPKYQSRTLQWKRRFQWEWFFTDFLLTPGYGLSGWIIDGSTGAFMQQPGGIDYDFATGQTDARLVEPKSTSDQ